MRNLLNDVLVLIFWVPKNNTKRKIEAGKKTTVEIFRHFYTEIERERRIDHLNDNDGELGLLLLPVFTSNENKNNIS